MTIENLAFLCLRHHESYDRRSRQAKGFTVEELRAHRTALLQYLAAMGSTWTVSGGDRKTPRSPRVPLSLEVYDRKLRIYQVTQRLIRTVVQNATVSYDELQGFRASTEEALFMFGPELDEYLRGLFQRGLRLHLTHEQLSDRGFGTRPGDNRPLVAQRNAEHVLWFTEQLGEARNIFARYIAL